MYQESCGVCVEPVVVVLCARAFVPSAMASQPAVLAQVVKVNCVCRAPAVGGHLPVPACWFGVESLTVAAQSLHGFWVRRAPKREEIEVIIMMK